MKELNLTDFCGTKDIRAWMHEPFVLNGRKVATDGKSVARMGTACEGETPGKVPHDQFRGILKAVENAEFGPMPAIALPEPRKCNVCQGHGKTTFVECLECDGEGEVTLESDFNEYEVLCKSCEGMGGNRIKGTGDTCGGCNGHGSYWHESQRTTVPGIPFDLNPGLLSRIIDLEGLQVAVINIGGGAASAIAFKSLTGDGAIMGMRAES